MKKSNRETMIRPARLLRIFKMMRDGEEHKVWLAGDFGNSSHTHRIYLDALASLGLIESPLFQVN